MYLRKKEKKKEGRKEEMNKETNEGRKYLKLNYLNLKMILNNESIKKVTFTLVKFLSFLMI